MSICTPLTEQATNGVLPALRAIDCLANETTSAAFGRLFGGSGLLAPALSLLLTLYVAFFALSLLTGRSRLGVSALVPRMMTLGLVLTFATSWVAYQGVVWNLAIGAPDQIASVITGAGGSATQIFADRMDLVLRAIADVAQTSSGSSTEAATHASSGSFTPGNLMWLAALLLLLGTVGILVTARIALAILLSLGPVFLVFSLFTGTRGLTAGWLRGVVLTAVVPLFVVIGGGLILELLVPAIVHLRTPEGVVDGKAALALFMVAAVHVALMSMTIKVSSAIVAGWRVFGLASDPAMRSDDVASAPAASSASSLSLLGDPHHASAGLAPMASEATPATSAGGSGSSSVIRTMITQEAMAISPVAAIGTTKRRAHGVGSRFKSQPRHFPEIIR